VCVRAALAEISESVSIPVENLALPEMIRHICFEPPAEFSASSVAHWLHDAGAREWQIELIHARLSDCFERVAADPTQFLIATPDADE
jgi:ribonuclease D